jgi:hypothetical protein
MTCACHPAIGKLRLGKLQFHVRQGKKNFLQDSNLGREYKMKVLWSRVTWTKSKNLSPKQTEHKGLEAAQLVEHLPCKCKVLSSNDITTKKIETDRQKDRRRKVED